MKIEQSKNEGSAATTGIALIIVIVVGLVVWAGLSHQQGAKNTISRLLTHNSTPVIKSLPTGKVDAGGRQKTYIYPGNYFQLSYPSTWTLTSQRSYSNGPFPVRLSITPPNAPKLFAGSLDAVSVTVYKSISLGNAVSRFATAANPSQTKYFTLDGYNAIFQQYTRSRSSETHLDDNYAISNGNITVEFYFRVSESAMPASGNLPPTPAVNETNLLPEFNSIVASIKF